MGQYELNAGLAEYCHKPGGPGTNPQGVQGSKELRRFRREFREELDAIAHVPCLLHPHDPPLTRGECLATRLWDLAQSDVRWAAHLLLNRWLGKVPLNIDVQQRVDVSLLFSDHQRERYRDLIDREAAGTITYEEQQELRAFRRRSGAPQLGPGDNDGSAPVE